MSETKCILIVCYLLLSVVLQAHGQVTDCCLVRKAWVYWKCIFFSSNKSFVFASGQHAQSQAEFEMQMKKAQQMTRSCQQVVQATEDDLKELQTQQKPSSESGKCLHACLMESIGLVLTNTFLKHLVDRFKCSLSINFIFLLSKMVDGKLSVEKSTELIAEIAQGNNELFDIAKSISNDCAAIQDDDRCVCFSEYIVANEPIS